MGIKRELSNKGRSGMKKDKRVDFWEEVDLFGVPSLIEGDEYHDAKSVDSVDMMAKNKAKLAQKYTAVGGHMDSKTKMSGAGGKEGQEYGEKAGSADSKSVQGYDKNVNSLQPKLGAIKDNEGVHGKSMKPGKEGVDYDEKDLEKSKVKPPEVSKGDYETMKESDGEAGPADQLDEYKVRDPKALAAEIGRKKYGKDKFQKAALAGKSLRGEEGDDAAAAEESASLKGASILEMIQELPGELFEDEAYVEELFDRGLIDESSFDAKEIPFDLQEKYWGFKTLTRSLAAKGKKKNKKKTESVDTDVDNPAVSEAATAKMLAPAKHKALKDRLKSKK